MISAYPHYHDLSISVLNTPVGYLLVYANNTHVKAIEFNDAHPAPNENAISIAAKQQLVEYLAGTRKTFSMPLAPEGTAFQQQVWCALKGIDYASTASYLDISKAIGNPKACRAVGAANGKNPIPIVIPCHRIIGSNGALTGYAGGLARKTFLLDLEAQHA